MLIDLPSRTTKGLDGPIDGRTHDTEDAVLMWLSEAGKKILGVCRWSQGYCSTMMDGFVVGLAPVRCTTARLKQDKRDNVNLKWDSNSISNR